jgi:heat shock protein HtpX
MSTREDYNMDPNAVLVHSFKLDTELSHEQLQVFPKFVRERMSFGQLPGIRMGPMEHFASSHGHYIEFLSGLDREQQMYTVRMYLERPAVIEVWSTTGSNERFEKQLDDVFLMTVQFFEEEARKSTLYMTFMPGSPRTAEVKIGRSVTRILFGGNMLNLFLLSILIGFPVILLFQYLGLYAYAPLFFLVMMFVLVLSAGKISTLRNPWKVTKNSREVVIVQHMVPEGEMERYRTEYVDKIRTAKKKVFDTFANNPAGVSADKVAQIFAEAGLPADQNAFMVKKIDVYGIVERAAAKFGISVPSIVISRNSLPNAAATGFSRKLATMIITLGLLVQLEEEEIELVVGHELSHLKSGDPMVLFSMIAAEYLGRVYIWWQYISFLWLPYLILIFWLIFFFGKFLESRADLEAGIILGKPKVMAESLKKIGFRRLVLQERYLEPGVSRFGEWLRFDPHPPMYFRIQRLESLDLNNPPKHPFLSSVRAVAKGFVNSGKAP